MTPQQVKDFVLAGNALFTVKSLKTGKHFTFKVRQVEVVDTLTEKLRLVLPPQWIVKVLTWTDNSNSTNYTPIGKIAGPGREFITRLSPSPVSSAKAFGWFWKLLKLEGSSMPSTTKTKLWQQCTFHHAGRCGRCGRLLTVPESIESGIGPECAHKREFEAQGGVQGLLERIL